MTVSPYDVTYCSNNDCPFKDCFRHQEKLKALDPKGWVSIANYAGICKRYLTWLVEDVKREAINGSGD